MSKEICGVLIRNLDEDKSDKEMVYWTTLYFKKDFQIMVRNKGFLENWDWGYIMSIFNTRNKELEARYEELRKHCEELEKNKKYDAGRGGYNDNGFDHIVSLGYNCEVSYRIKDYIESNIDSFPLSWAYIHDQSQMSNIIEHLEDMFTGDTTVDIMSGMVRCVKLNVSFHSKISHVDLSEDNKDVFKEKALAEMNERYVHLRNKFRELFHSDDSTLFVIKCQEINEYDNIIQYLGELEEKILEKYISKKFFLLAVTDDRNLYEMLKVGSNSIRGCALISQFADDADTEKGGDTGGWLEAISYFNHIKDIEYNNMCYTASTVGRKNGRNILYIEKFAELKAWCDKLQDAKDWLVIQYENKCKECEKLREEVNDMIVRGMKGNKDL